MHEVVLYTVPTKQAKNAKKSKVASKAEAAAGEVGALEAPGLADVNAPKVDMHVGVVGTVFRGKCGKRRGKKMAKLLMSSPKRATKDTKNTKATNDKIVKAAIFPGALPADYAHTAQILVTSMGGGLD